MRVRDFIGWYRQHDRVMALLQAQTEEIVRLNLQTDLHHARNVRDLVDSFLQALEYEIPEEELKAVLEKGLRDLNDHVARLEEHV